MQPARRHPREPFAMLGDEAHDFPRAFVRRISQRCLAPHFRAAGFQRQGEVLDTQFLWLQSGWNVVFASRNVTWFAHGQKRSMSDT